MSAKFIKRSRLVSKIALAVGLLGPMNSTVHAADWTGTEGGTGSWGLFNTTAPTPGWNDPSGFPNAQGAVAQLIGPVTIASPVTVQDTGAPVTVGTINYGNNNDLGDFYWQITNTNGITLDQDGGGPGFATISNSSTTAGGLNALYITTGTLTLADDLHVTNTATGSTNNVGAIQLDTALAGSGNITFNNSAPIDTGMTATRARGSIRLSKAATGFTGNVAVEKGLVVLAASNALGTLGSNVITLGKAGSDSATLVQQGTTAMNIPNEIVVAANNTGTLTLGGLGTGGIYTGKVTLNSNATVSLVSTAGGDFVNFNAQVTGPAGLIKEGAGSVTLNPILIDGVAGTPTNDFAGDVVINAGTLAAFTGRAIPDGAGKGNVIVNSGGAISVSGTETINGLSGTGFMQATTNGGAHTFVIGANDATSTFDGVMRNAQTNRLLTITKTGAGTLTLTGANVYSGVTTVNGGTLQFARQVSLYNNQVNGVNANNTAQPLTGTWTATNIRVNAGATAAFNVGGTDEFTEADITLLSGLSAAATDSGFGDGSSIGLDTTNAAGGEFVYNNPITNTFDGANSIGLKKLGANTLTLTATSTYTGNTTVAAGTLNITGNHTTGANYSVATGANLITNNVRVSNSLSVDGTATINTNGGTAGASKVETLTIGGSGKLNLKDNDLVVGTAASVDTVRDAIVAGKANNAASGITSDLPAFATTTGFGYAMGNDAAISPLLGGFLTGQSYDADSVLVKYTFLGDADLDGDSDLNDLGLWAQAFTGDLGNPVNPATYWTSGDFDYDGDTDLNDLGFWAGTFTGDLGGGAGSLIVVAPGAPAGAVAALNSMGITVVPEPSTFVLAGVGLAGLAIASRRRKN